MALTTSMKLNLPLSDIISHDERMQQFKHATILTFLNAKSKFSTFLTDWRFARDYKNRIIVEGYKINGRSWVTSPIRNIRFVLDEMIGDILYVKTVSGTVYKLPTFMVERGFSSIDFSKREKNGWNSACFYKNEHPMKSWSLEVTESCQYYLVGYVDFTPRHSQFATSPIISLVVDKEYGISFLTRNKTLYRVRVDESRFKDEEILF
tara:strand:+ start:234 stop:854 length:621 start_codon:yes stop_codon:yes gene_type:complete